MNPVLREGNSDRRVAQPVKARIRKKATLAWERGRLILKRMAHMQQGDFYSSEQSYVSPDAADVKIVLQTSEGSSIILKQRHQLQADEIIDAAVAGKTELQAYLA